MKSLKIVMLSCLTAAVVPAAADFVPDNFDGSALGSQWVWNPGDNGVDPTTSTYSVAGGALTLTAAKGADQALNTDGGAYIEQDQPAEAEWTVETKLQNYAPADPGNQHRWNKAGIALVQDNNHWIYLSISSDSTGLTINSYGQTQLDSNTPGGAIRHYDEFQQVNIGYYDVYYLRIRKNADGYIGELSYDQSDWIPLTPLIRNPHTNDGTMNGKIRLFTATGAPHAGRNPAPAQFDYVVKTPTTPITAAYDEDEFDFTSDAVWRYNFGDPRGTAYIGGGAMTLNPAGLTTEGGSDIFQGESEKAETGVIAWQNAPTTTNFSLYTKVDPTVLTEASAFAGRGIRLWQNQNCWAGIKIVKNAAGPGSASSRNEISAMFVSDDNTTRGGTTEFVSASSTDPAPSYLRVDKVGNQFRMQYSADGVIWTPGFQNDYTGGWVTLNLKPTQPILVQLFSALPNGIGAAVLPDTHFEFVRSLELSSVNDWQLF